MALQHEYIFVFLFICIAISSARHQDKRSEGENGVTELLKDIENVLYEFQQENEGGRKKVKREVVNNCPTGEGVLQVKSNSDVFLGSSSLGGLGNLIYMCGTASIEEEVPAGWTLKEGPGGHKINMTLTKKQSRVIPLCCPGYGRNNDDICVPKCKGSCDNGVCVSPMRCECFEGYTLNSLGNCVVTCPCGCHHGQCSGEQCLCDPGYALDESGKVCNPVCNPPCENAECVSPETCECQHGYRQDQNNTHKCSPHCSKGCRNGKCLKPDVCICNEGYFKSKNTSRCVPRCLGCGHGRCIGPYNCVCDTGYGRVNETCKPICESECINATCTAPSTCTCLKGYEKSGKTSNVCSPRCWPRCKNARCTVPGYCECFEGYYKKDGESSHECKTNIVNVVGSIIDSIRN